MTLADFASYPTGNLCNANPAVAGREQHVRARALACETTFEIFDLGRN